MQTAQDTIDGTESRQHIETRLRPRPGVLRIMGPAYQRMIEECREWKSRNLETGGMLFGYGTFESGYLMMYATGPGPNPNRTPWSIALDADALQPFADRLARELGVTVQAQYHLHPGHFNRASSMDDFASKTVLLDPRFRGRDHLMIVITLPGDDPRLVAYRYFLSGGSTVRNTLPVEIVDPLPTGVEPELSIVFSISAPGATSHRPAEKHHHHVPWLVDELRSLSGNGIETMIQLADDGSIIVRTLDLGPRDVVVQLDPGTGPVPLAVVSVDPENLDDLAPIPGLPGDLPVATAILRARDILDGAATQDDGLEGPLARFFRPILRVLSFRFLRDTRGES